MRGVVPAGQGPDPAPGPVPAVAAGGGPELVLAVGRVDPVAEPQPGHRGRGADGHAAPGGAVGEGHLLAELGLAGVPDGHVGEAQEVVVVQVGDEAGLLEVADVVGARGRWPAWSRPCRRPSGASRSSTEAVVVGADEVAGLGRPAERAAGLGGRRVGPAHPGPATGRASRRRTGRCRPPSPTRGGGTWWSDRVVEAGRAQVGGVGRAAAGGRPDGPGPAGARRQGPALDGHRVVEPGVGDLDGQHPAAQLGGHVVPDVVAEARRGGGWPRGRATSPPPDDVGDQGPGLGGPSQLTQVVALAPPAGDQPGGGRALAEAQVGLGPVVGRATGRGSTSMSGSQLGAHRPARSCR